MLRISKTIYHGHNINKLIRNSKNINTTVQLQRNPHENNETLTKTTKRLWKKRNACGKNETLHKKNEAHIKKTKRSSQK
jgi:hypothetical protein